MAKKPANQEEALMNRFLEAITHYVKQYGNPSYPGYIVYNWAQHILVNGVKTKVPSLKELLQQGFGMTAEAVTEAIKALTDQGHLVVGFHPRGGFKFGVSSLIQPKGAVAAAKTKAPMDRAAALKTLGLGV